MAGRSSFEVEGFKELDRALKELGGREAKKIARKAVRVAAKPVQAAARANAPVEDGRLRRSISIRVDFLGPKRTMASALVYVSSRLGPRPRLTQRRSTVKGSLQAARYSYQIGSWPSVYGSFVEFGTMREPPRPFLRPAWQSQGRKGIELMRRELGAGISAAAAKLGPRRT